MSDAHSTPQDRPAWPAVWNGLRRTCPNCTDGPLFKAYLTAVDACPTCGTEYHAKHRADDGPAYVVILVVAHVLGLLFHLLFEPLGRDPMTLIAVLIPVSVGLCLWMLPRVKGAFIGLQWAKRMHGFGGD